MHNYPQNQSYVGSSGQTLTTNVSTTLCSWQICHQTHLVPNQIMRTIGGATLHHLEMVHQRYTNWDAMIVYYMRAHNEWHHMAREGMEQMYLTSTESLIDSGDTRLSSKNFAALNMLGQVRRGLSSSFMRPRAVSKESWPRRPTGGLQRRTTGEPVNVCLVAEGTPFGC